VAPPITNILQISWLALFSEIGRAPVLQGVVRNLGHLAVLIGENHEVLKKRWQLKGEPGQKTADTRPPPALQDLISHHYYILALGERILGRIFEASAAARESLKFSGENALSWELVGYLHFEEGAAPEALGCFSKATELIAGGHAPALLTSHGSKIRSMMGRCHSELGNHCRALDEFKAALELDFANEQAMFNAALQYQALGNSQAFISMASFQFFRAFYSSSNHFFLHSWSAVEELHGKKVARAVTHPRLGWT
jgi:tetratricopeptide (TPR) repeat protein